VLFLLIKCSHVRNVYYFLLQTKALTAKLVHFECDDLFKSVYKKKQTDLILLDFSKAFDKVHNKLALKLHDYGIIGSALKWVKVFLDNHHQSVIVNGSLYKHIPVSSGVPQGSVLGPLLFLIYINDLPMNVESKVRLLADDTALYVTISTSSQSEILQKYLDNLERWSHKREMEFKPSKCQFIHVTRSKNPIPTQYTLHNCILQSVSSTKYLGVDISSDISWDTYIDRISKKANNTLGFLRRNIKIHSESLKSSAYIILVRLQIEYCSTVWRTFTHSNISKLEAVHRIAARWVKRDYGHTSSATYMMQSLHCRRLDQRRIDNILSRMYKITHNLIDIPISDIIIPLVRHYHSLS